MKVTIINGPNLNLLGKREPDIYGNQSFEDYLKKLKSDYEKIVFTYLQSNVEGEIINALQIANETENAVIINPAGYSHTSVAIADAITAMDIPVIEVHISNIYARESYRHQSLTGAKCRGVISGFGLKGYELALIALIENH